MQRRFAEYRLVPRRSSVVWSGLPFRSVRLNGAGWAVFVGLCLLGAGAGFAGGRLLGFSEVAGAVGGGLVVLGGLALLDRRALARDAKNQANSRRGSFA